MKRILILDANQRSALAIIRSLGKRGLFVIAADYIRPAIGSASKYVADSVHYRDPSIDPVQFKQDVSEIVRQYSIDIVIPATDITTMLLAEHPESVGMARLACAPAQNYDIVTDKKQLISLAQTLGVPVPDTRIAFTASEIETAASEFGYPLILKPARSRYIKNGRIISTAVVRIDSSAQLLTTVTHLKWLGDLACLVQRFIPGHGAGIFALYGYEAPVAWFAHKRIREKPLSGGVSVVSESAPVDPQMQNSAQKLLSAAAWFGVAMVEFRVGDDGIAYLMEINGRFWGSLQLAIDSGVDFPWLLYKLIKGDAPAPITSYALGQRLRWVLGDLDNLILQLRRPNTGAVNKAKAIGHFAQSFFDPRCHQEVFRWSDPRPGLREARQWLNDVIQ